jgi:hypothetical protein
MTERQSRSRLRRVECAMSQVPDISKASKHRRQAAACGVLAVSARSEPDRELLLRMQRSLLRHACYEDWVDGLPPVPPTRASALPVPGLRKPSDLRSRHCLGQS